MCYTCLLYTSDAADEQLRVDLGGRRIIKKKFFKAEDGIRDPDMSRGLGDVYKRQVVVCVCFFQSSTRYQQSAATEGQSSYLSSPLRCGGIKQAVICC